MTSVLRTTCDKCGAIKVDKYTIPPDGKPWWDFQYISTDFPLPGGNSEFKSGSWDLCPTCSSLAYNALVATVGKPSRKSDPVP